MNIIPQQCLQNKNSKSLLKCSTDHGEKILSF